MKFQIPIKGAKTVSFNREGVLCITFGVPLEWPAEEAARGWTACEVVRVRGAAEEGHREEPCGHRHTSYSAAQRCAKRKSRGWDMLRDNHDSKVFLREVG